MHIAKLSVDWKLAFELAPNGHACAIFVEPRSPAGKAGLKTGDYVVSASTGPAAIEALADLEPKRLPPGTEVYVRYHRPGWQRDEFATVSFRLRDPPRAPAGPPAWRHGARVEFGEDVRPEERKRFLAEMSTNPKITATGIRLLARLLFHYDGQHGIYPKVATIARDVRLKKRATQNQIRRLEWAGVLEVVKCGGVRTESGRTNRYFVHWPRGWGDTVVKLERRQDGRTVGRKATIDGADVDVPF